MVRLSAENRRRMIAQAALKVAKDPCGLAGVNHSAVAKRCPVQTSTHTVRHYFALQAELQLECLALDETLRQQAVDLGLVEPDA